MAITDTATHALLIDGEDVATARTRTIVDPATGEPIAEVADGGAADAERAVAAAKAAYRRGDWSRITPGERAAVLDRWPTCSRSAPRSSPASSRATRGKPLKFSSAFDLPLSIDNLRFFAAAARNLEGKASGEYLEGYTSTIRREPLGVCASIAPWNYPLNMACWKVGPALAGRQRRRAQAVRADPADRADARPPRARGRPAARDPQRRPRPGRRGRRARSPATPTSR